MSTKVTLGGDRLGAGKKMQVALRNFERSTHDLSYIWRSTMAPGTLVPYLSEVALPGDTFDINLDADVKTYPTIGPLFGSFKLQLDVFMCPIRLYQAQLHNNKLRIGMNMDKVKLPLLELTTKNLDLDSKIPIDIQQINPSSLLAYLGFRGIGYDPNKPKDAQITKRKNAIPTLAYWDIYLNYYANKQEEIGYVINTLTNGEGLKSITYNGEKWNWDVGDRITLQANKSIKIVGKNITKDNISFQVVDGATKIAVLKLEYFFKDITISEIDTDGNTTIIALTKSEHQGAVLSEPIMDETTGVVPELTSFPLKHIEEMRESILANIMNTSPFIVNGDYGMPYDALIETTRKGVNKVAYAQQGLGVKTYQSDIFNNWLSTEWIEGANGINEISAVDVSDGKLQIDAFLLAKKVYDMLNRIAVSGGTYYDWLEAVYSEDAFRQAETPVYMGGLSKEIVFEEVVSNAETDVENIIPLGTLAGKGRLSQKHKGGSVVIKVNEPSYILGIVSITPRIDYSQGNRWDTRLETMDDLHKPSLDGIGFQDLITEQMAWWDTHGDSNDNEVLKSAGKQPAWINYMTNYNRCYGNFADESKEMFMTLNRRYEMSQTGTIKDLTTYIDPSKFNYMFAQTDLTSQNFWVQIGVDIEARRKISARQIPNL